MAVATTAGWSGAAVNISHSLYTASEPVRLSKSRLLSHLQCPKRLWLEVHRPHVGQYTSAARARFESGQRVGEMARQLYTEGREVGVASGTDDWLSFDSAQGELFPRAGAGSAKVFFEATFRHEDVQVRADVLEYCSGRTRLIEVKSGTRVKEEYVPDVAIQSWVINGVGVRLDEIAVAHLNSKFVYPGNGDYRGLLVEVPLGELASHLVHQVATWGRMARHTLAGPEPEIAVGKHCRSPHECPFVSYCWPHTEYPLDVLKLGAKIDEYVAHGYRDVRDVPETAISGEKRLRVWRATLSGRAQIESALGAELRAIPWPRYYLDFEAIDFAVPIWAGTHPRQAIPFQWSIHVEKSAGQVEHREYLDLTGEFPAPGLAQALLEELGESGPIVVFSHYERGCIETLAQLVPALGGSLRALVPRLVNVLPLFQRYYYHPAMKGSWSLKAILPTVVAGLRYQDLGEIREGEGAQQAYLEAIHPSTSVQRRDEIARLLREYCRFDTHALVQLLQAF